VLAIRVVVSRAVAKVRVGVIGGGNSGGMMREASDGDEWEAVLHVLEIWRKRSVVLARRVKPSFTHSTLVTDEQLHKDAVVGNHHDEKTFCFAMDHVCSKGRTA